MLRLVSLLLLALLGRTMTEGVSVRRAPLGEAGWEVAVSPANPAPKVTEGRGLPTAFAPRTIAPATTGIAHGSGDALLASRDEAPRLGRLAARAQRVATASAAAAVAFPYDATAPPPA